MCTTFVSRVRRTLPHYDPCYTHLGGALGSGREEFYLVHSSGREDGLAGIQYKCPACAAPIEFDASLARMRCDYCSSTFEVAEVERFNAQLAGAHAVPQAQPFPSTVPAGFPQSHTSPQEHAGVSHNPASSPTGGYEVATASPSEQEIGQWEGGQGGYLSGAELADMRALICNSCGAEIIADPRTISTRCGFCNNTFISVDRLVHTRVPDLIIPFSVDRKAMLASFLKASKGKFLLPRAFRDEHRILEATGTYIPYWMHDGVVSGHFTYNAEIVRTWSDSANVYTETRTFRVERGGEVQFRGVPICGTKNLEATRSEGVEPYRLEKSKEFATAYLSGYAASSYDVEQVDTVPRANQRISSSLEQLLRGTIQGFHSINLANSHVDISRSAIWYALLPVWLVVIDYRGDKYPFAINGDTGEVVGSFPIDKRKLSLLRIASVVGLTLLFILMWEIIL